MASWERYAFAILRGGVKGIPLAGGMIEEVLRVLDEERDVAGQDATGIVSRRAEAKNARDLAPEQQLELEDLAKQAARTLSEEEQADLKVLAERLAGERDPGRRREQARLLGAKLTRGVLDDGALRDRLAGAGVEQGLGQGAIVAGKYRLIERLGKGGFGTVWRAKHELLGQDVAIKLLNPEVAQDDEARARFLKEVQTTTSFVHERAVQLRDFGQESGGQLYFTMDLIVGRTLRDVLDQEGRLAPARVVRLGVQALEVIEKAHEAGIVHRDLKPQNLIVTTGRDGQEEIRVLDFGIAKAMSSAQKNTSGLTLTGMTVGTLRYMSPEQVRGKKLDGRSDLYSLGAVLYECLAGRLPIEADPDAEDTRRSLEFKLATDDAVDLGEVAPQVPAALRAAVMRALAKLPDARFTDARGFREALRTADSGAAPAAARDDASASFEVTNPRPVLAKDGTESRRATGERAAAADTASSEATGGASRPIDLGPPRPAPRRSMAPVGVLVLVAIAGGLVAADVGGVRTALVSGQSSTRPGSGQGTGSTERPPTDATEPSTPTPSGTEAPAPVQIEPPRMWSLVDLSPADGTTTRELAIDVAGRLDPPGPGEVRIAGITRPIDEDGRFSLARLGLEEGENRVSLVARPARPAGASEDPPTVECTLRLVVDRVAPRLTITAPAEGVETLDDAVEVRVEAEDATPVQVHVGEIPLATRDEPWSGRGTFTARVPLPEHGPRSLDVLARDAAGNEVRATRRVVRVAPSLNVTLTEPAEGAWLSAETVRVAGRLSTRLPLDQVELRLAGVATPLRPDGTFQATLRLAEGAHDLEAKATARTAGGSVEGRATRRVSVDLTPPTLRVISPRDGVTTTDETITLDVEANDASPWVDVTLVGPVTGTRRVNRGERHGEQVRLPVGATTIVLTPVDAAGNRGREVRVTVTRQAATTGAWPGGPASLPAGVRRGERTGEYVNEKDGTILVWIPPGTFRMGSNAYDDEKPVHEVRFAQGFFLGKYETTWGQYRAFCRATGRSEPSRPSGADDSHPVVNVDWNDAVAYCRWAGLRLPSEAEWEYACRAGSTGDYCYGNGDGQLGQYAWYSANAGGTTKPVGQKQANAWGLHDVHGNVWEWVQDAWHDNYNGAPSDGRAWDAGSSGRVRRGGGWIGVAWGCRAADRAGFGPGYRDWGLGFRPAR